MAKIKTSELAGAALDWTVAKCEGIKLCLAPFPGAKNFVMVGYSTKGEFATSHRYLPSSSWAQGGPLIEREISELYEHQALECWAAKSKTGYLRYGPTPLIAAMRCYVASKLDDEVDVPEELL